jgi:Domain of unknown function
LQNPEKVIFRMLVQIGCSSGRRVWTDQLKIEKDQQKNEDQLKVENDQQKNEEKETKRYESMAKNMTISSVLIASAAFAAAFTICASYMDKRDLYDTAQLNLALKIFVLMDAYAFLCSIIATAWLVQAALPLLDPSYRKRYLLWCTTLVMMATNGLIIAFGTGAYLILTPISKWIAKVCLSTGIIGTALLQPHHQPNFSFIKIAIYKGPTPTVMSFLIWVRFHLVTLLYVAIVYELLVESPSKRNCSPGYLSGSHKPSLSFKDQCPEKLLNGTTVLLVLSSSIPLITILAETFLQKDALKYHLS